MSEHVSYIESYCHKGKVAALVQFTLNDSFTIGTDEFLSLAKNIAMHIAACSPESVEVLMQQPYVKDNETTIAELLSAACKALQTNISVTRFLRWDTATSAPALPDPPRSPANVVHIGSRHGA
jgi:elongation factor Ts